MIYLVGLAFVAIIVLFLATGSLGRKSSVFSVRYKLSGRMSLATIETVKKQITGAQELVILGKPTYLKQAVVELDKALNIALDEISSAEGFVEKMKTMRSKLDNENLYQRLWYAHKVRNIIVHEVGTDVPANQLNEVISIFINALNILIGK